MIKNAPKTPKIPPSSQELKEGNEILQNIMNSCTVILKTKEQNFQKCPGERKTKDSKIFE